MEIKRLLSKKIKDSPKSLLLIGPRQTGKSTLIRELNPDLSVNLMHETTYLNFAANPSEIEQLIQAQSPRTVFIDEIQRLPSLLNTIQYILDETKKPPKFYLTGSSARKLRRGQANLIPGRLFTYYLGPICSAEMNYRMTNQVLSTGTLPEILTQPDLAISHKLLQSYTGTYLKEEIQAEALTKNLQGFARFLFVVAGEATRFLDLSKLADQAQIDRHSAVRWFEVLEDTLLVHRTQAFAKSTRKRLTQHPRFFFFDNGILNALLKNFAVSTDRKGFLFENLVHAQLVSSANANDIEIIISHYRTEHGAEIDFIVEKQGEIWAIECKAATQIKKVDQSSFRSFESFYAKPFHKAIAYLGTEHKVIDGVHIYPWQKLLSEMGL